MISVMEDERQVVFECHGTLRNCYVRSLQPFAIPEVETSQDLVVGHVLYCCPIIKHKASREVQIVRIAAFSFSVVVVVGGHRYLSKE